MTTIDQQVEAFGERLFAAAGGFADIATIYLGRELGLYEGLATLGSTTSAKLAAETGTAERYIREWLEQQAVSGIVTVADETAPTEERLYSLPEAHRIVLTETDSLAYMGMIGLFATGVAPMLPTVAQAYRTGEGVPWEAYGEDLVRLQEAFNKPQFLNLLAQEWIPAIPDVHTKFNEGATVADIACGAGWSSIAIATAFPNVTVHGFDLDEVSIAIARRNAEEAGVADRVRFEVSDASDPAFDGTYDVAFIFEALHDMTRPVEALQTVKRLVGDDGIAIVMDEACGDHFTTTPDNPMEALFYAFSTTVCLPNGLIGTDPVGTGTVMRPSTLQGYATDAGFERVEALSIEHPLFRFYRLH